MSSYGKPYGGSGGNGAAGSSGRGSGCTSGRLRWVAAVLIIAAGLSIVTVRCLQLL